MEKADSIAKKIALLDIKKLEKEDFADWLELEDFDDKTISELIDLFYELSILTYKIYENETR